MSSGQRRRGGPAGIALEAAHSLRTLARLGCEGLDIEPSLLDRIDALWRPDAPPVVLRGPSEPLRPPVPGRGPAPLPGPAAVPGPGSTQRPARAGSDVRPPGRETLEAIRADLGECRRCGLCEKRARIVFGEGNPKARLVFVGEGPGADEDREGRPFVGKAGKLLDNMITAMHLRREDVYICNVIKCRPPENRNPAPVEIATCKPFLLRQLAAIRPAFVCGLGRFACQSLLETDTPIGQLRGRLAHWNGAGLLCTFHPAYLLRSPAAKRDVWRDLKLLLAALGH